MASSAGATFRALFPMFLLLSPAVAAEPVKPRVDCAGDPLPTGAVARLGTLRYRLDWAVPQLALAIRGNILAAGRGDNQAYCLYDLTTGKEIRRFTPKGQRAAIWVYLPPDGKILYAESVGSLAMHDAVSGAFLGDLVAPNKTLELMRSPSFSANGKRMAVTEGARGDHAVSVWELATNKKLATMLIVASGDPQVALSADGKLLATWGYGRDNGSDQVGGKSKFTVQIWDVATARELQAIAMDEPLLSAAISPDSKRLVVADTNANLSLWDLGSGKQIRRWAGPRGVGHFLLFSPDGKQIVGATSDGVVHRWETESGKRAGVFEGPPCKLTNLAFRDDGTLVAAGIRGLCVRVWEPISGKVFGDDDGHSESITELSFSRDSKTLITHAQEELRVWNVAEGRTTRRLDLRDPSLQPHERPILQLTPDGDHMVRYNVRDEIAILETKTGNEVCRFRHPAIYGVSSACAAAAPRMVSVDIHLKTGAEVEAFVIVRDYLENREIGRASIPPPNYWRSALAPDGSTFALALLIPDPEKKQPDRAELSLWSAAGVQRWKQSINVKTLNDVIYSPDGSFLALAHDQGNVRFFDAADGSLLRSIGPVGPYCTMAFSPDGRTLATTEPISGPRPGVISLWEAATGKKRGEFTVPRSRVNVIAFSPDGRLMASANANGTALLWDMTGRVDPAVRADIVPAETEFAGLWAALGSSDGVVAFRAVQRLAMHPQAAAALVRKHLPPATEKPPSPAAIAAHIADLDSDEFEKRDKASKALLAFPKEAEPFVVKALAKKLSVEKKRLLQEVLDAARSRGLRPDQLGPARALEALERAATPETRRVLEQLAQGRPDVWLTCEAKAVLKRLPKSQKE